MLTTGSTVQRRRLFDNMPEGSFDADYLPQVNNKPDPEVIDNDADGLKDDNDRVSPSPIQKSNGFAPSATDGERRNPRAEVSNPTSTLADEKITGGIIGTKILTSRSTESSEDPAGEDLSRRSTAEIDKEPLEDKSIVDSAINFCQDAGSFLSVLDDNTNESFQPNKEKMRRLIKDFESIAKDIHSTGETSNLRQASESTEILYRVRLQEQGKSDKFWYQDVPFFGVDLERIQPAEDENVSIFDVVIDIEGKSQTDKIPAGETRKAWKRRKDIVFGKDISVTSQKIPAIKIYSSHLLSALRSLITYYPSQMGDMSFVLHPYKMLLQQYLMMAAFRSTYTDPSEPIAGHSITPVDKPILHERASGSQTLRPPTPIEGEMVHDHKTSTDQKILPSASLVSSHGHTSDEQLLLEQKIQEILDLDTSLEVETGKPWKDHDFRDKCDKVTAHHIGVLLGYLEPAYHKEIVPELKYHKDGKATFKKLWILFQPGINVYALVNGQYAGFVVLSCETLGANKNAKVREDQVERVVVTVWNLAYAGQKIHREAKRFVISSFEGLREIASMEVFPIKYLDDNKNTWSRLQVRGIKYFKIIQECPAHRAYNGHTLERDSKKVRNLPGVD